MPELDLASALEVDQKSELSEEDIDESIWDVQPLPIEERPFATEQDAAQTACRSLARCLRSRPTLPPDPSKLQSSWTDVASAVRLPAWHCAFKGCSWSGRSGDELETHLQEHQASFTQCRESAQCAGLYSNVDLYEEAIACLERE
eukprot:5941438-Karenia_brevis.AAC.1